MFNRRLMMKNNLLLAGVYAVCAFCLAVCYLREYETWSDFHQYFHLIGTIAISLMSVVSLILILIKRKGHNRED